MKGKVSCLIYIGVSSISVRDSGNMVLRRSHFTFERFRISQLGTMGRIAPHLRVKEAQRFFFGVFHQIEAEPRAT
jgi:predicted transcriptional regulator